MSRVLLGDQVANLRDLGGSRAVDASGGQVQVRPGRLLRSAALTHLPPAALEAVTSMLGPLACFDLRTDEEVERDGGGAALAALGWRWHRVPLSDQGTDDIAEQRSRYRTAAAVVAAALVREPTPALVCCSLGKDRTGMVVALLLHRIGVGAPDIAADFEFSNACLASQRHLLPARWQEGHSEIQPVSAQACLAMLAQAGRAWPGVSEARLRDHLTANRRGQLHDPTDQKDDGMSGTYQQVLDIVGRVLQYGPVDPLADFFDLDANSLAILQIVELINDECGSRVTMTDALDAVDIDTFAQLVAHRQRADAPTKLG